MIGIVIRCSSVLWLAFVLLVAPRVLANADDADKTLSPYFFVENGDPAVDRLPLESTKVVLDVTGVIADVTVTQTYTNDGKRPINARYVFPASTRAAVHGMRMVIGEQVIEAKIRERKQAKTEFEAAKKEGKSASLLEQQRPNVFTMSVANVMPGDRIDVTLRYTELLVPTSGVYEVVYPTVVGPRYSSQPEATAPSSDQWVKSPYTKEGKAPRYTLELSGTLSSGIPVQQVASPSHRSHEVWDNPNLVRFVLDEKDGGNRDFILRYRLAGDAVQSGLMLYEASGEKFFLLLVEPPARVTPEKIPPREYVFVLDVSGSMYGFPLDTAKELLRNLVAELRPVDRFNVLLFSGASALMAPQSLPATQANVDRALAVIDQQQGGGGTELLSALQRALGLSAEKGWSRSFVIVTDGYVAADAEAAGYVRDHLGDANVFSFGIGSSVNRYLVEGLAKAGMGEPFVVTEPAEAPAAAQRFHEYIASPVLTDVKVAFDGFDAYDVLPASVPDVLAERPVVVQGKYRGDAKGGVAVTGVSGTGAYAQRFDVARVASRPENRPLRHLWARTRIALLSDFAFGEPSEAEQGEITRLGLRYNLLTRYTSFVAVSKAVRNTSGAARNVDQPLPLPLGVSNHAVGMTGAPEPELLVLAVFAALLAAGVAFSRRWRARAA